MQETDRTTYIGGSDIVQIMGASEYGTWADVYKRLVHKIHIDLDPEEKRDLLRGQTIEPVIESYCREHIDPTVNGAEQFERYDTENRFEDLYWNEDDGGNSWNAQARARTQIFARDRMQDYLGGHIDGVGINCIHEFKAPRTHNIDRMSTYGVKPEYVVQCQFYMMITGIPYGMIHVWDYDSWEPLIFNLRRDQRLHDEMRALTRVLWESAEAAEPPAPVYQKRMGFHHLYDQEELDADLEAFLSARDARKEAEKIEKMIRPRLMSAAEAVWPDGEKTVQFMTVNHHLRATRTKRGETEYVNLTVKQNEIAEKVESREE